MTSIRSRLVIWVISLACLILIAAAIFTWLGARQEIHQVFDAQLVQIARMLSVDVRHESGENDLDDFLTDTNVHGYGYPIIFQIWSIDDKLLLHGPNAPKTHLSDATREGYSNVKLNGEEWRVYTLFLETEEGAYRIQVADKVSKRHDLILTFVFNTMKPLFFLLPFIALFWIAIDTALGPLRWVAEQVSDRDQTNLCPVSTARVPSEISPLVNEINGLLRRLKGAIERQSRYAENAAHELRTPIAGAMTQLQVALKSEDQSMRLKAVNKAFQGLRRLDRRVGQLLTLARIDPESMHPKLELLDLELVAAEVLAEKTPSALGLGIEIEMDSDGPVNANINRDLIEVLLVNVIDNAINVTPPGGKITLRTYQRNDGACISVEDTGPGISEEQLLLVFDRYHRVSGIPVEGTGLGLSIVQSIADIHGASVILENRLHAPGVRVTIEFPS